MSWLRSLRRTFAATPTETPPVSRRRFFAGAGAAVLGSTALADPSWAAVESRAAARGIVPGTLVDAQGRPLSREPMIGEPLLGTIIMAGFNFAPRGWAFCDGQLLAISSNEALFSLLGTIYGGDGRTTFALPDLRGRMPIHQGTGPGLTNKRIGDRGGAETSTLTTANLPPHAHSLPEVQVRGTGDQVVGAATGGERGTENTSGVGNGQSFGNMPPYLTVNFIIALQGLFPSRS
jgi:microcystin-dependent protein